MGDYHPLYYHDGYWTNMRGGRPSVRPAVALLSDVERKSLTIQLLMFAASGDHC